MPRLNLNGHIFGKLLVLKLAEKISRNNLIWVCKCECGVQTLVLGYNLKNGTTKSCGCLQKEMTKKSNTTHGQIASREYRSWGAMRNRCNNPKAEGYKNYGGRGIKVCKRWEEFENFYADMGDRPENTSIDRINNDGNYEPGNCKWSTRIEQNNNKQRSE